METIFIILCIIVVFFLFTFGLPMICTGDEKCILPFCAAAFCALCLVFAWNAGVIYKQKEAVKQGHAKFVVNDEGKTSFQWNDKLEK